MGSELEALYSEMRACQACRLRDGCSQVVPGTGQFESPRLLIVGEAPGEDEDREGEPFVGRCGQLLREVIRQTGVLNRTNTLISNTVKCRPPQNKFPRDECPAICVSQWLSREIAVAKPERMLLLGGMALKHVAGMDGIKSLRGRWHEVRGVRTMATYHPSYIMRCDNMGDIMARKMFERDINEVAQEVKRLEESCRSTTTSS